MDKKTTIEMEEYSTIKELNKIYAEEIATEAYPAEMLAACLNGKPCSYGICDECPIVLGNNREDENEDD